MSTSKKARASSPADEEKKELWDKYGRVRCDGLANSLKKDSNKTSGYRHVYPVSKRKNLPRYLLLLRDGA